MIRRPAALSPTVLSVPRAPRAAGLALLAAVAGLTGSVAGAPGALAAPRASLAAAPPVPATPTGLPAAVEDLQPYLGQIGCDPVDKAGVVRFQSLLLATYRDTGRGGISRDCAIGGQSEHKEGRAYDWGVSVTNPSHVAEVKALTDWLTAYRGRDFAANARRFGIMYMIWNHQIWKAYQPDRGWQPYTGADPHTNHVHFSFGWNGAYGATSWWTRRVAPLDPGPYTTTMPAAPRPPAAPPPPPAPALNAIDARQAALGGDAGLLGPALGPEADVPGGRYRPYRSGAIYWSAATGAQALYGAIGDRYRAFGASASPLGLPVREEADVPGGRTALFQRGRITWSTAAGAHEVHGALAQAYVALGAEGGLLGLPLTDEAAAGTGRGSTFARGALYWSPATGAHEVHGAVRAAWAALGGPRSVLGLPTADEAGEPGGRRGTFAGGRVLWSPATGAHALYGAVLGRFLHDGGVTAYGFPVGDEHDSATGRTQELQRVYVDWDRTTGATTVRAK